MLAAAYLHCHTPQNYLLENAHGFEQIPILIPVAMYNKPIKELTRR